MLSFLFSFTTEEPHKVASSCVWTCEFVKQFPSSLTTQETRRPCVSHPQECLCQNTRHCPHRASPIRTFCPTKSSNYEQLPLLLAEPTSVLYLLNGCQIVLILLKLHPFLWRRNAVVFPYSNECCIATERGQTMLVSLETFCFITTEGNITDMEKRGRRDDSIHNTSEIKSIYIWSLKMTFAFTPDAILYGIYTMWPVPPT